MKKHRSLFQNQIRLIAMAALVSLALNACAFDPMSDAGRKIRNLVGDYQIEQITGTDEPETPESVSAGKYVYATLNDEEKQVYDQIFYAIDHFETEYALSTTDPTLVDQIYNDVMADYGGLFWQSGYSYNTYSVDGEVRRLDFSPSYTMTQEEKESYEAQIEERIPDFLEGVSASDSDYDKSKAVFENLITLVDYDLNSENNQNILSVFLGNSTVCQGYSCAANVLLERLGIQSCIVNGFVGGERHAWNLVRLDGAYYYFDATWGNSRFQSADSDIEKHIDYAYLNFNTADMNLNYEMGSTFELPECTVADDNYYHHENLYFENLDYASIGQAIARGYTAPAQTATIRLADESIYNATVDYFVTDSHVGDYCIGLKSYRYLTDEDKHIITFLF